MRDYLEVGSAPWDEECAQVGTIEYRNRAYRECKVFVRQIKRVCGEPPGGAYLRIKQFGHDFGKYYEVVVYFDAGIPIELNYAFKVEGSTELARWDNEAREELFSSGVKKTI